jgi:phosphoribosylformimino-5-aminoimidazole carboxamide ribotide isomerase
VIIFPAMDLWGGEIVKLEAGRHRTVERVYGRPEAIAARWTGLGAPWLHVVDLNASIGEGGDNVAALDLLRGRAKLQWGGGVRDDASLDRLLAAGVDRAIVGTKAVQDWDWLARAAKRHPGRVMVSIDGRGREILIKGWQESAGVDAVEFVKRANELALGGYLYTNVAVEGRGQGVDWAPVEDVVKAARHPVVFSGGVSTLDDVRRFRAMDAYGLVIGSSMYLGRIDYLEAVKAAKA